MVTEGVAESGGDSVTAAITAMFERDGLTEVVRSPDGSFPYP
jgi:hypothetical protein